MCTVRTVDLLKFTTGHRKTVDCHMCQLQNYERSQSLLQFPKVALTSLHNSTIRFTSISRNLEQLFRYKRCKYRPIFCNDLCTFAWIYEKTFTTKRKYLGKRSA